MVGAEGRIFRICSLSLENAFRALYHLFVIMQKIHETNVYLSSELVPFFSFLMKLVASTSCNVGPSTFFAF